MAWVGDRNVWERLGGKKHFSEAYGVYWFQVERILES